jgi:hypothetical protein
MERAKFPPTVIASSAPTRQWTLLHGTVRGSAGVPPIGARISPPLPLWERDGVRGLAAGRRERLMSALPGVSPLIPNPSPTRGEGAYPTSKLAHMGVPPAFVPPAPAYAGEDARAPRIRAR